MFCVLPCWELYVQIDATVMSVQWEDYVAGAELNINSGDGS